MRPRALVVGGALLAPTLAGCGSSDQQTANIPPPVDMSQGRQAPPAAGQPQPRSGMSTTQKMVLLAGAAALYYMYKKHQNAQGQPTQYYRSETNGRIYYRDPKTHQAIYVTPPQGGIQVPADEAQAYSDYQGYNRQNSGQTFGGYGYNPNGNYAPAPAR
jgi:hypothetical protein